MAIANASQDQSDIHALNDKHGTFERPASAFRSLISPEPGAQFPPEANRYILYLNYGCPWCHRTSIVRALKGLEDIIKTVVMDYQMTSEGWIYTGRLGTALCDPLYGFTKHRELYLKANPQYNGRFTVPVLWDTKNETIVNNESSEIIRIFFTAFDSLLSPERREVNHPWGGLRPVHLEQEIDEMNEWVYNTVNNGVYKTGFASTQEAYETNVLSLFANLDRLESILARSGGPFLLGKQFTEADIRLFPTLVRFDVVYYNMFKCNLKMIRHDYPNLLRYLLRLYHDESKEGRGAFKKTTYFEHIKRGYAGALGISILPLGPTPEIYGKETM